MNRKITQIDVENALERLKSLGKPPTLDAIRAAMGNKGSKATIIKLLKVIKAKPESSLLGDRFLSTMPLYLSKADFYEKLDDKAGMDEAINYLISEKDDPTKIMSDLCVVIQRLRLEVKQCNSEMDQMRNLLKNVSDTMQTAIRGKV
ncbi:DNA-binding protein [Pseudomonas amygdali]|uniref:DNA-binding protein n=1 Tax=Pseudomonas amygdali TaxID=47877 RepID=UPI000C12DEFF|nr:DNA-binding protein [Pseudomonas amygdali]PHX29349.1 hypothetical protein AO282_06190 [Pseudomonas amygdali pv. morsprunorum]